MILKKHDDEWALWYLEEKKILIKLLPKDVRINHIGSAFISNIYAKPIVDILVEANNKEEFKKCEGTILKSDYICMSKSINRVSFNKGYTVIWLR